MSRDKNILCISNTAWEGFYTKSTVQLMSLLARQNKILFVEYPYTIKDLFFAILGKARAPVMRMTGLARRLEVKEPSPGVLVHHLVVPPVLPVEFIKNEKLYDLLMKINASIYSRSVKRALRKLKMDDLVCINAYNSIYGNNLKGMFGEKLLIFYCYDGPNIGRYGRKAVTSDQDFACKADSVIVTSEFLSGTLRQYNTNINVVKNGVDFENFHKHAKKDTGDVSRRKKAGYIGSLDQRFDIDTVEYAVSKLPHYDFEFTGELMNKTVEQRLSKYNNVRFCPPVQAGEVPALLNKCDAGLIPYLCTEYTRNVYPLKINEYLSVGVPVVLTSFADLPEFKHIVSFTSGKEDFCEAIVNEIESDSPERIGQRILFAEKNSWESRAEQLNKIIEEQLGKKLNSTRN